MNNSTNANTSTIGQQLVNGIFDCVLKTTLYKNLTNDVGVNPAVAQQALESHIRSINNFCTFAYQIDKRYQEMEQQLLMIGKDNKLREALSIPKPLHPPLIKPEQVQFIGRRLESPKHLVGTGTK